MGDVKLYRGDCLDVLPMLCADSIDAIVTDPPAGIAFMGKEWDDFRRARNPKDTGRNNVFGRTSAKGPEYGRRKRKQQWQYPVSEHGFTDGGNRLPAPTIGSSSINPTCRLCGKRQRTWKGGPEKCVCPTPQFNDREAHLDAREVFVSFLATVMRECLRVARPGAVALVWAIPRTSHWTATALEDAGWLIEDRISHLFGTGFPKHKSKLKPACEDWWLCRKPGPKWLGVEEGRIATAENGGRTLIYGPPKDGADAGKFRSQSGFSIGKTTTGRWPANVVLDEDAGRMLDEQSDSNGASRFFYCSKASRRDRGEGNTHPTVKNTSLMSWLIRLACPAGGTVLDPFLGSGSTAVAAIREGRSIVGIEQSANYLAIARRRIRAEQAGARKRQRAGA